jgi:hypothetical protein
MEENEFFSRKSSCSPPSSSFPDLDKEMLETSPIKKTISMKSNNLENFVPRLRPKRVYYSTKEIRTFSLDNDDSDCSDTEKEQDNDNNNNQNKDKDKKITSQKKHSVVLSPKNRKLFLLKKLQPNTVQSKKSLFYSHYEDESHNDNDNNTDIQKMNNKLDENDNNPKNENNNNNIEMDYDSDISEKSVDSFSLD